MKFVTFQHHGHQHAGVISQGNVVSLKSAGFPTCSPFFAAARTPTELSPRCSRTRRPTPRFRSSAVKLCAPVPKPTKIVCVGLNYRDHAIESKMEIPTRPTIFSKYNNTVIGPGDNIVMPKNTEKPDYEAEFAFVIGKGGRHIKAADWRNHVFGYMNLNDVSARDVQLAISQWTMGKTSILSRPWGRGW